MADFKEDPRVDLQPDDCCAQHDHLFCNLRPGHSGAHQALGSDGTVLETWPQTPAGDESTDSQRKAGEGTPMCTVRLPVRVATHLAGLAREIREQDNHGTSAPYFYVVRCRKEVAVPDGTTDQVRYWDGDSVWSSAEKYREFHNDGMAHSDDLISLEGAQRFLDTECQRYCVKEDFEHQNVFFTQKGYEQHMHLNGHNYRHFKDTSFYIQHAFRNPEMGDLLESIEAFTDAKVIYE